MLDINCNGIFLRKDLDIIINKITPEYVFAQKRIERIELNKINGAIYKDTEVFEPYDIDVECTIKKGFTIDKIREIKELFKAQNFELILSKRQDTALKAKLLTQINFNKLIAEAGTFLLSFKVQPFAEIIEGRKWVEVKSKDIITNKGNYTSEPLLKVNGTGTIFITYNNNTMRFYNVKQPFIIDCELEDIYGLNAENLNDYMDIESDFTPFPEGEFEIEFTGASKVEIMPRWRDI